VELKVGDKVRCINEATGVPIGARGAVTHRRDDFVTVAWDDGGGNHMVLSRASEYLIKEFQPGCRVVEIATSELGTIYAGDYDQTRDKVKFSVLWERDKPKVTPAWTPLTYYAYKVPLVAHAPPQSGAEFAGQVNAVLIRPPEPSPLPPPALVPRGPCYLCGRENVEMNSNGLRICPECKGRR